MKKWITIALVLSGMFLWSFTVKVFTVDEELLKIAKEYRTYNLYNGNLTWTIALCEPYSPPYMAIDSLQISRANSEKSPHGDKLYKLYIKYPEAYTQRINPQPDGQVLIKEVWNVKEVDCDNDSVKNGLMAAKMSMITHRCYTTDTRKQLFIMYKTTPSKENDKGWWYGIVDIENGAENATVIESMKINRCVKCHQETKYDRIFGPY